MNAQLPKAAELAELPLTDDDAILARVATLVPSAARHQLWLIMLDDRRCQIPTLVPIDLPRRPDDGAGAAFAELLRGLVRIEGVAHLVLVYERPGPAEPSRDDLAWLAAFEEAFALAAASVAGLILATGSGVRHWGSHHDAAARDA